MKIDIDDRFLSGCRNTWAMDKSGHMYANSVMQNGLSPAALDHTAVRKLPYEFNVDVWNEGVTDQGDSLRCWAFASLNNVRQNAGRHMNIAGRNFELSQNYIYFYDQLEKSNDCLNRIIKLRNEPSDKGPMMMLLRSPVMDNGQWYFFADISDKYGVVPKEAMPDTWCSRDTRQVTNMISMKLRIGARNIRRLSAGGASMDQLYAEKENVLAGIYAILCRFLGEPPKEFDFDYRDNDGVYHSLRGITPQYFFRECCGVNNDDYIMIIHHPSPRFPFMQVYTEDESPEPKRGHALLMNVDMPLIKQMVIAQLQGGEQVVVGSDVSKQNSKALGYMDEQLYDYDTLFGTEMSGLTKAEKIEYRMIKGTHIMAFDGVNLDAGGRPERWKVQNSYGEAMGIHGHYVMSDRWFEEYVLSVVINKKYVPQEVLEAYAQTPVLMAKNERY